MLCVLYNDVHISIHVNKVSVLFYNGWCLSKHYTVRATDTERFVQLVNDNLFEAQDCSPE